MRYKISISDKLTIAYNLQISRMTKIWNPCSDQDGEHMTFITDKGFMLSSFHVTLIISKVSESFCLI